MQEEIENVKIFDNCQSTDILQRIWAKGLNHVYKRDTESFETVAQFVLQHTESMLFGVRFSFYFFFPLNILMNELILVQLELGSSPRRTTNSRACYAMDAVINEPNITRKVPTYIRSYLFTSQPSNIE